MLILIVAIPINSIMIHNEVTEIILILWTTSQRVHDMIIENNFHRLYSPGTQAISQKNFTIKATQFLFFDKLNKAYNHKKN